MAGISRNLSSVPAGHVITRGRASFISEWVRRLTRSDYAHSAVRSRAFPKSIEPSAPEPPPLRLPALIEELGNLPNREVFEPIAQVAVEHDGAPADFSGLELAGLDRRENCRPADIRALPCLFNGICGRGRVTILFCHFVPSASLARPVLERGL